MNKLTAKTMENTQGGNPMFGKEVTEGECAFGTKWVKTTYYIFWIKFEGEPEVTCCSC